MAEVAWVFGGTAAGKDTLIRHLLRRPPVELLDRLSWIGKSLSSVGESRRYVAQFENDPIIRNRLEIVQRAKELARRGIDVVLIKGQTVDLEMGLPRVLRDELPVARHRILFLDAPVNVLYARAQKKPWWGPANEAEGPGGFAGWLEYQIERLRKLEGFELIALDSTGPDYRTCTFPLASPGPAAI